MTRFSLWRYIVIETAISITINTLVATAPTLLSFATIDTLSTRPVRDVPVSLTPQFLMSALVPSLLTRWRQGRGRLDAVFQGARPTLVKTVVVAAALAVSFTIGVLASIHLMLPWLVGGSVGSAAILVLAGVQAALAAALMTPLALVVLFGARWTWTSPRFL